MQNFKIEQTSSAVTTARFKVSGGWEQCFLLMSDNHHDSVLCNRDFEKEHLEEAKSRNARIIIGGDFFDAMQGKFDPRRSMDDLRPEYRRGDYYDYVVKDSAKFLAPYAENILLICRGNHESAVYKNASTDLTDRLVFLLNLENSKANIVAGGYGGWLRILLHTSKTHIRGSLNIKYFHGAGGDAPVTKGAIQTNRQAVYLPDADIVLNGHNHQNYIITVTRERLNNKGHHYFDNQYHVRIPGYRQSYADGTRGWDVETGKSPKPIGAVWMHVSYKAHHTRVRFEADVRGPDPVKPVENQGELYDPFPEDSEFP